MNQSNSANNPSPDLFTMPYTRGQVVGGKYEIERLIGTGGIGYVVSARHIHLGDSVALKFLRPEFLRNEEIVHRFAREARTAVRIKSDRVVRVIDAGRLADGAPFLAMELLHGRDLAQLIREVGALPCERSVEYILQACEALATAHATGIVHRDVKPENLYLTKRAQGEDFIKVLDFGISKSALSAGGSEHRIPIARTLTAMGSPPYMSPEQVRVIDDIDARTDIWSLGCVLYELLTSRPAFMSQSLMQMCASILEQTPPAPRTFFPNIPQGLENIVFRCLEKDRDKRYPDISALALALCEFAPRRAHEWAERAHFVLHGVKMTVDSVHSSLLVGADEVPISLESLDGDDPRPVNSTDNPVSVSLSTSTLYTIDSFRPGRRLGRKVFSFAAAFFAVAGLGWAIAHRGGIASFRGLEDPSRAHGASSGPLPQGPTTARLSPPIVAPASDDMSAPFPPRAELSPRAERVEILSPPPAASTAGGGSPQLRTTRPSSTIRSPGSNGKSRLRVEPPLRRAGSTSSDDPDLGF